MNRMAAVAAATALGLVGASPVSATTPADTQYGNPLTQTTPNGAGSSSHGQATISSALPFTGLDLGLAVAKAKPESHKRQASRDRKTQVESRSSQ